jgi:hypothetical protein
MIDHVQLGIEIHFQPFIFVFWNPCKSQQISSLYTFISNFNILPLISQSDIVIINELTLDTENYWSVSYQTHYDVADNFSNVYFEGLCKHYH